MEGFMMFLLRASIYLLVFAAGYYFFLSRNHIAYKRFYIVFSFFTTIILASVSHLPISSHLLPGETFRLLLPEILITSNQDVTQTEIGESKPSVFTLLSYIPVIFLLFFFKSLILKLVKIFNTIKKHPRVKYGQLELVILNNAHSPFSFFKWVFIPCDLRNSQHFDKVIRHETAHFRHGHTWDVVFLEIMRMLFWFHPCFYYMRNHLQELHEFEADKSVLKYYSRPEYQQALLDCTLGALLLPVTNPFNVSPIKKRFLMMNNNENYNLTEMIFRSVLIVPFLLAAFALQAIEMKHTETATTEFHSPTSVNVNDTVYTEVDVFPEYPGGDEARMQFLQTHLRYPEKARIDKAQGTVFVSYIVEKDGQITNIKIIRSVSPELDEETIRVVGLMPKWKPGYKDNQPVRVQFNMPLRFVL
jgi:TonB family protein